MRCTPLTTWTASTRAHRCARRSLRCEILTHRIEVERLGSDTSRAAILQEETRCEAELGSILYSYYKRWATQINGGSTLASRDLQFLQDVTDFGASIDPEYETYDIAATIDAEPLAMAAAYSSTSKLTMDYIQQCELCTTYSPQFCATSTPT